MAKITLLKVLVFILDRHNLAQKEATIMEGMCKEGHVVIMEEVVAVAGVMAMILGVETEINSVDLHLQCKEDTITRHSNLII